MTRTDRLLGIILALRAGAGAADHGSGGRQTAAQLAARFGVSRRTILRDIDALGEIGVPVVAFPGAGGGFGLADGYWLPPLRFAADEVGVLLLALRGLGEEAAAPFGPARRAVEEKLRAALRPELVAAGEAVIGGVAVTPPRAPDPGRFRAVQAAIRDGRWLRVEYHSLRRVASHLLLPRALWAAEGRWFCRALSVEARAERVYRLDRMGAVAPVPVPADAAAALAAAAALPHRPYDDPGHPEVVIHLSYQGVRLAEDASNWAGRFVPRGVDSWELRFRCPPAELPYYARELHALGPTAVVVGPPELRRLVRELALATAACYVDDDDPGTAAKGDRLVSPITP